MIALAAATPSSVSPSKRFSGNERALFSEPVLARLTLCLERFHEQEARPARRRRRVGIVVRGASPAQRLAIATFFAERLTTNIAFLDAAYVEDVDDVDAADYVLPLIENVRRVALVEGLTDDLDPRLRTALLWSSREVLVVACVGGNERLDARMAACYPLVVDCRVKVRSLPFATALRV
jgi:hypothetical protein